MADHDTPDAGPRRPRAPTITIDTSAAGGNSPGAIEQSNSNMDNSASPELRSAGSFESNASRPVSPHNISSPTTKWNNGGNLLSVPGAHSRSEGTRLNSSHMS